MTLLYAAIYNVVLAAVCVFALIRGGKPERSGATINLAASALTGTLQATRLISSSPTDVVMLMIDASVAAMFFWLAIRTTRFWPIWAFGFALGDLILSAAGILMPKIVLFIYNSGLVLYAYLALFALALGTNRLPRNADPVTKDGFRSTWQATHQGMS